VESRPATGGSRDSRGLKEEERGSPVVVVDRADGQTHGRTGGRAGGRASERADERASASTRFSKVAEGRLLATAKECARPAPRGRASLDGSEPGTGDGRQEGRLLAMRDQFSRILFHRRIYPAAAAAAAATVVVVVVDGGGGG